MQAARLFRKLLPLLFLLGGTVTGFAQNPPDTTFFQFPEELEEMLTGEECFSYDE